MSVEPIQDKVLQIVSRQYNVPLEHITLETKFVEDLQGDSLDLIETAMEVEDEFNICLADETIEKFRTVNDVVVVAAKEHKDKS